MLIVRLNIQNTDKSGKQDPHSKRSHSQYCCPMQDSISRPHFEKRIGVLFCRKKKNKNKPERKKKLFFLLPKGHKPTHPRT